MVFSLKNMFNGSVGQAVGIGNAQFKQVQAGGNSPGFARTLNKALMWAKTGSDLTATADIWVRMGQYTVPPQQRIHVGYGVTGGNPEEIGRIHMDLMGDDATNSVAEKGYVRLGYTNANETITAIIWEGRSEEVSDSSTTVGISRSDEILLPETPPSAKGYPAILAQEDSKIILDFKADTTDIIVETAIGTGAVNIWKLPVTVYQ